MLHVGRVGGAYVLINCRSKETMTKSEKWVGGRWEKGAGVCGETNKSNCFSLEELVGWRGCNGPLAIDNHNSWLATATTTGGN